jgi:hypothetical protein
MTEERKHSLQVTTSDDDSSSRRREKIMISRQKTPVDFAFMSIRSSITKKQYPRRLKMFFDHMGLKGNSLEEQAQTFLTKAKEEPDCWVEDNILFYLNYHKDRVLKTKEIAAGTLYNLYAPIIIFCKRHKHSLPSIDWDMLSERAF